MPSSLNDLARLEGWLENREGLLADFELLVARSHRDDPWPNFAVDGCSHDIKKNWLKQMTSGVPEGSHNAGGGHGPDRPTLVELAARLTAFRSRRWYPVARTVRPIHPDWQSMTRESFPFLPFLEVGPGWSDLIIAMSGWIAEIGVPEGYDVSQIKEKYGSLRWYDNSQDNMIDRIVEAGEWLSHGICDRCGRPGTTRDGGWLVTRCDEHA